MTTIDDDIERLQNSFALAIKQMKDEQEEFWGSLDQDQQLKAFCAVVRRIHKAELVDRGTYRYALYHVFGFGPESYMPAQVAGYLDIHNSMVSDNDDEVSTYNPNQLRLFD